MCHPFTLRIITVLTDIPTQPSRLAPQSTGHHAWVSLCILFIKKFCPFALKSFVINRNLPVL